ncbi:MAG TPA: hypothetical protein HPP54_09725 [Nitrospinae bacterium]|nr:hypothetical protein [Nitrospinota bacterium]
MASKASGLAIVAVVVFAFGLAGLEAIGIHEECKDGIDNDGGSNFDMFDGECLAYPYADGNGETHTPPDARFNSHAAAYTIEGHDDAFTYSVHFYQTTVDPYNIPAPAPYPTPFCSELSPGVPFFGLQWSHFPSSEGSQQAFNEYYATCPP